jgi:hypothetical protein
MAQNAPPAMTRAVPMIHCAVAHGGEPLPLSPHAATEYGDDNVTIGWPETVTRGNGVIGTACPPCMQITDAPT